MSGINVLEKWQYLRDFDKDDIQHDRGECKDAIDELIDGLKSAINENERLRTYAQLLENKDYRKYSVSYLRDILRLNDMREWIIPDEHRSALQGEDQDVQFETYYVYIDGDEDEPEEVYLKEDVDAILKELKVEDD